MVDNVLTNYDIKFNKEQLDFEQISKSKLFYKIYNNKISEPLHKFWFSVGNIKYCNNYKNYKTIRFLMNDKDKKISNLINFIKDIGDNLKKILNSTFPNITVDFPWKESEQFPCIFSFFTNSNTIFLDSKSNNIEYDKLSTTETFSIIFEISNVKIMPINLNDIESFSLKINLSLILIKQDEKKNIRNYNFSNLSNNDNQSYNKLSNINPNLNPNQLPFLNEIDLGFKNCTSKGINKDKSDLSNRNKTNSFTGVLNIDQNQLVQIKNTLKKVENNKIDSDIKNKNKDDDSDDNDSNIKSVYMEKKNSLRRVSTKEKSLLTHLKIKKRKKSKNKKNPNDLNDELINTNKCTDTESITNNVKSNKKLNKNNNDLELERELDLELERELELELELKR